MTDPAPGTTPATPAPSRGGRPRDPERDAAIVSATLDLLAETGYEGLTTAAVAARAGAGKGAIYRRWPSKAELVAHAVGQIGGTPRIEDLPDTGTLRGDLVALMRPQTPEEDARTAALMAGIASLLSAEPALAEAASTALVEPFVASQRLLMERARDRGEIPAEADVDTVALVTPSMTAFRLLVQREPLDVDLLVRLVDTVVLPALTRP